MARPANASFALLLLAAALLLVDSAGTFQSLSVDLAHHYALVVRLSEDWVLQSATDPSLGEMNTYPGWRTSLPPC